MKQSVLGFFLVFCSFLAEAQVEREEPQSPVGPQIQLAQQRILGKVVDQATGRGMEAASVQVFVRSASGSDSLVRGQFTKANGEFVFEGLPQADSFRVDITGIGYTPWSRVSTGKLEDVERFCKALPRMINA